MVSSLLIFLLVLSLLIFIHEFGHFITAKIFGIKIEEFGFGYPPRLWAKKIKETTYSINIIPFGGFVKLLGQDSGERKKIKTKEIKKAFFSQPKKIRALIIIAGILGNFFLGILCFTFIYCHIGIPVKLGYLEIQEVIKDSPAYAAGLEKKEKIYTINNQKINNTLSFLKFLENNQGKTISITTNKGQYNLTLKQNPLPGEGRLGLLLSDTELRFFPWWQMPFRAAFSGLKETAEWTLLVLQSIIISLHQLFKGIAPEVSGPIGIFQLTSQAAKAGYLELVQFIGILSVNLAVLNLLPFPALDGGHLLFLVLADFLGKKRKEKIENIANALGMAFLLVLMLLITINDLSRIFKKTSFYNFFQFFFK